MAKEERARATFREAAPGYGKPIAIQRSPLAIADGLRSADQVLSHSLTQGFGMDAELGDGGGSSSHLSVPQPSYPTFRKKKKETVHLGHIQIVDQVALSEKDCPRRDDSQAWHCLGIQRNASPRESIRQRPKEVC